MPKQTKIKDYLSQAELLERYHQATQAGERTRWQIIYLLSTDKTVKEVVEITHYSAGWVRNLVRRYNAEGPTGLNDRRRENVGVKPLLDQTLQAELALVLQSPPPDLGLWDGPKVAAWIAAKTGRVKVHRQRGWDYLTRLGYTLQQPRPHHAKADKEAGEQFKKN